MGPAAEMLMPGMGSGAEGGVVTPTALGCGWALAVPFRRTAAHTTYGHVYCGASDRLGRIQAITHL